MFSPPQWLPFFEYVLIALEHPPNMFVSKLAVCCTMLFLTRSDPELLRSLSYKWGVRFIKDRARIIARLRRRDRESYLACGLPSSETISDFPPCPKLCDPDECVSYLLKLLNTLVSIYFSYNWRRTEDVININMEYERYVRENVLPMCMATEAEEDVSDGEETVSLLPLQASSGSISQLLTHHVNTHGRNRTNELRLNSLETPSLTFGTFSNVMEHMRMSLHGLVLVFHARFSAKSCEALTMFENILKEGLLNPVPTVCIVHAVTEPELANLFNISWFPTIIYIPSVVEDHMGNLISEEKRTVGGTTGATLTSPVWWTDKVSGSINSKGERCNTETKTSEFLHNIPSLSRSSSLTLHGSSIHSEDLSCIIERGVHSCYPANGALTIYSLVKWINSKGLNLPQVNGNEKGVSHLNELREDAKFKKRRESISTMMILRQLQYPLQGSSVVTRNESPVFIFLGGGMAAGKSTAATALSRTAWWEANRANIVLVNADDFKAVMAPLSRGSKEIHESSTRAAEQLMVRAINQGRNIVFDSTMMWRPFIMQVIDMVRNAHTTLYEQGVGYSEDGVTEKYFTPVGLRRTPLAKPYEIRLLAITVQPEIAVPRGILRRLSTGRVVPISTQIRSFRLFAENFSDYLSWVDAATLYNNNVFADLGKGELPPVLAEKTEKGLLIHDEEAYALFMRHRFLNEDADNLLEIYLPEERTT